MKQLHHHVRNPQASSTAGSIRALHTAATGVAEEVAVSLTQHREQSLRLWVDAAARVLDRVGMSDAISLAFLYSSSASCVPSP